MFGRKKKLTIFPAIDFIVFNRAVARLFYLFVGMPRCGRDQFKNEVLAVDPDEEEIEFYYKCDDHLHNYHIIYFAWFATWILKNLYATIYTVVAVSHIEVGRYHYSMSNVTSSQKLHDRFSIYGCLITNCTRLSKQNVFIKDFRELPVFEICHPNFNVVFSPLVASHSMGLGINTVFTYLIAIIGIYFPIINYIDPHVPDSRVFPVTPTFSIRSHRERARKYLIELFTSMENYYCDPFNLCKITIDIGGIRRRKMIDIEKKIDLTRRAHNSIYLSSEMNSLSLLKSGYVQLGREVKDYLADCLPLARSYAWAAKANEVFALLYINSFVTTLSAFVFGAYLMINYTAEVSEELKLMDNFVKQSSCGIWLWDNSELDSLRQDHISLSESVQYRNWVYVFDLVMCLIPGVIVFSSNFVNAIVHILEMDFMMKEQVIHAGLAMRFAELLKTKQIESNLTEGIDIRSSKGCFNMDLTRYKSLVNAQSLLPSFRPLSDEIISLEIISQNRINGLSNQLDMFVDLLMKVNISNRIIKGIAHNSSGPTSAVISISYAVSYISVATIIFLNRKFDSSNLTPIILAVIGLTVSNTLVILTSRVQSVTNRLIQSLWSIVAATESIDDPRVRHMRRLMIKQVVVIGHEGTLKLHAFGLPITYASLFEAVIWSSTLAFNSFNNQ